MRCLTGPDWPVLCQEKLFSFKVLLSWKVKRAQCGAKSLQLISIYDILFVRKKIFNIKWKTENCCRNQPPSLINCHHVCDMWFPSEPPELIWDNNLCYGYFHFILLHIIAELKIGSHYSEIWAAIPSNPGVFTAHLAPSEKKSRKRREVSEQITQFRNNKGIFCPGTHTLWRAICC